MKKEKAITWFLAIAVCIGAISCQDDLELTPPGEFSDTNILQTEAGLLALLNSAYFFENPGTLYKDVINMNEVSSDIGYNTGGGENRTLSLFVNFTWDASTDWINARLWSPKYQAIRDANIILENIDNVDLEESLKSRTVAEARYIRASSYAWLYNYFGPVPLRTTSDLSVQEANLSRATDEEMLSFIETELTASIPDLPAPGDESQYGRATKGHAFGVLTKFLLNTKQWSKVISVTDRLMSLGYYELFPVFRKMFFVQNEQNREMVVAWSNLAVGGSAMEYQNGAYPPGFKSAPNIPEFEWTSVMANWATQYRFRDAFVDSFDPGDARLMPVIQQYENLEGETVNLRAVEADNSRNLKFFDQSQQANWAGNDMPYIRYADILLSRAEALNEVNGPSQEALDLINQVRARAGLGNLTLAEASSKEILRNLILDERGWEFMSEGKRREDLIRHGKYIERALDRGINAKPFHVLLPIPANEINANPAIIQNEGY